ncbi:MULTISPECIES: class I SAM-dependent methyltransferase [unclassified Nostoc]|uniref:class I SAM-dependent methyltransferase n=1 Tax=unclassified Nostoc TaxID=2593658 RepID=UPI002AD2D1EC|nr:MULTISPECIES: class I SAM-dependent methyltransferase [unclassified Nostoc]MDZ8123790.1 class I SAM-dependent methyltransferase [Nostoc sp. CmiVER01]MDZ8221580.1 class I SAM-dependent methyltransferase [Nostoc sp. ChiVER01]
MSETLTFDPIWEEKYSQGHSQRYPWDAIVSFVFRHYPYYKPRHELRILEVGCGTASNLWFTARKGFSVSGIDASPSAIRYAQKRFSEDNLIGDFRTGGFNQLPFKNNYFDLVIDRAAITCCGFSVVQQTVAEIRRVLQAGGKFYFNPYSDRHSSYASGRLGSDGLTLDISAGTLVGVGQICLYGRREIDALFTQDWQLLSIQHLEIIEQVQPQYTAHSEWRAIAQKLPQ